MINSSLDFSRQRALIVDDDKIVQLIVKDILGNLGYVITIANNGREAIDMINASNDPYDLITMDIDMPLVNGIEATRAIRQLQDNKNISKIIGLTSRTDHQTHDDGLKAGMNIIINKPLNCEELKTLIA